MNGTRPSIIKTLYSLVFGNISKSLRLLRSVPLVDTAFFFFSFLAKSTCEPHFAGFVKNIIKMLYKGLGQIGLDPRTHSKQNLKEYRFIEKVGSLGFPPTCFNLIFCVFCYEIPQRSETVACLIKTHHLQDVDKCWHLSC